jgi:hypothetical protein
MGKIEHLQFLVLMIPTFLLLAAAAVSMADLAFPASGVPERAMAVVVAGGRPGARRGLRGRIQPDRVGPA